MYLDPLPVLDVHHSLVDGVPYDQACHPRLLLLTNSKYTAEGL